jgi:hypothetical protein
VLYTDGVTDALGLSDDPIGDDRLLATIGPREAARRRTSWMRSATRSMDSARRSNRPMT